MLIVFHATLKERTLPHTHHVHEFIFGTEGEAILHADDQSFAIGPATTLLVPAGIPHSYDCNSGSGKVTYVCFDNEALEQSGNPALQGGLTRLINSGISATSIDVQVSEENRALLQILDRALKQDSTESNEKANTLLHALLLNHLQGVQIGEAAGHSPRQSGMDKIVQWVDDNLNTDINIDEAAQKSHMSRSVFTRSFKSYTNMSFTTYVNRARLKRAANLLVSEQTAIDDVAVRSGYRNMGHFYRQFQNQYGMTPSQFRKVSLAMTSPATPAASIR